MARAGRQEEDQGWWWPEGSSPSRPKQKLVATKPARGCAVTRLAAESDLANPLTFAPGKSIPDLSKGVHGALPGVSVPPTLTWCHSRCPRILPALGKALAWEAAVKH